MKLNTTRSMVLTAVFAGLVGLAGCDNGGDSTEPKAPGTTSEAPAAPAPAAEPAAPAPAAEPAAPADSGTTPAPSGEAPASGSQPQ